MDKERLVASIIVYSFIILLGVLIWLILPHVDLIDFNDRLQQNKLLNFSTKGNYDV